MRAFRDSGACGGFTVLEAFELEGSSIMLSASSCIVCQSPQCLRDLKRGSHTLLPVTVGQPKEAARGGYCVQHKRQQHAAKKNHILCVLSRRLQGSSVMLNRRRPVLMRTEIEPLRKSAEATFGEQSPSHAARTLPHCEAFALSL